MPSPEVPPQGMTNIEMIVIIVVVTVIVTVVPITLILVLSPSPSDGYIQPPVRPTGQFANADATSNTTATVTFAGFSSTPAPINLRIVLSTAASSGTYAFGANGDGTILNLQSGTIIGTITYRDYDDNDLVNGGDQLLITGLSVSTSYTVRMLWRDGSTLDQEDFNTPA